MPLNSNSIEMELDSLSIQLTFNLAQILWDANWCKSDHGVEKEKLWRDSYSKRHWLRLETKYESKII
jgi:hypothetical protein